MTIYKYMTASNAIRYLRTWHLKYSLPRDFNDPFDVLPSMPAAAAAHIFGALPKGRPSNLGRGIEDAQWMARFREVTFDNAYGVLCFTRTRKHLLMWAHYAENHQGAILGFDESAPCFTKRSGVGKKGGCLLPVLYSDQRPSVDRLDSEVLTRAYFTKSLEWAYEQEQRLLWPAKNPDKESDGHLLFAVPPDALCEVVLGLRATDSTIADVKAALNAEPLAKHVSLMRAALKHDEFGLDYESWEAA
jgi:hypothetical protein